MRNIIRHAERQAFCRVCDETIERGQVMISFYSRRNRGMWIHMHLECVIELADEAVNNTLEDLT